MVIVVQVTRSPHPLSPQDHRCGWCGHGRWCRRRWRFNGRHAVGGGQKALSQASFTPCKTPAPAGYRGAPQSSFMSVTLESFAFFSMTRNGLRGQFPFRVILTARQARPAPPPLRNDPDRDFSTTTWCIDVLPGEIELALLDTCSSEARSASIDVAAADQKTGRHTAVDDQPTSAKC